MINFRTVFTIFVLLGVALAHSDMAGRDGRRASRSRARGPIGLAGPPKTRRVLADGPEEDMNEIDSEYWDIQKKLRARYRTEDL